MFFNQKCWYQSQKKRLKSYQNAGNHQWPNKKNQLLTPFQGLRMPSEPAECRHNWQFRIGWTLNCHRIPWSKTKKTCNCSILYIYLYIHYLKPSSITCSKKIKSSKAFDQRLPDHAGTWKYSGMTRGKTTAWPWCKHHLTSCHNHVVLLCLTKIPSHKHLQAAPLYQYHYRATIQWLIL